MVFWWEEPEGPDVFGAVWEIESDDVGVDGAVGIRIWPGSGAVTVGLRGVGAVAVFEGIEAAGFGLVIVADTEEVACPLGGPGFRVDVVLADEFE